MSKIVCDYCGSEVAEPDIKPVPVEDDVKWRCVRCGASLDDPIAQLRAVLDARNSTR